MIDSSHLPFTNNLPYLVKSWLDVLFVFSILNKTFGTSFGIKSGIILKGLTAKAVPMTINKSHCFKSLPGYTSFKNSYGKFSPKKTTLGLIGPPHSQRRTPF